MYVTLIHLCSVCRLRSSKDSSTNDNTKTMNVDEAITNDNAKTAITNVNEAKENNNTVPINNDSTKTDNYSTAYEDEPITNNGTSPINVDKATDNDTDASAGEHTGKNNMEVMSALLKQTGGCFTNASDIASFVEAYEEKTENKLHITRSKKGWYKRYECVQHRNCSFFLQFGSRCRNEVIVLKKHLTVHSGQPRPPRANECRWKTPCGNLSTLQAIVMTIASRLATLGRLQQPRERKMSLTWQPTGTITLYVEQFAEHNPGSTTKVITSEDGKLEMIFIAPGHSKEVI